MKTENLIQLLVADEKEPPPSLERSLLLALSVGFVIAAIPYWTFFGPRADIAAFTTPRFLFKVLEVLFLALISALLVLRLAKPGADTRKRTLALLLPPALLIGAVMIELFMVPPQELARNLIGRNHYFCLVSVFFLSMPLLVSVLLALRQGAPVNPDIAGGVAGLLAASLAAAIYAVQCTDDSPLFVAVWYTMAIVAVGAVGAMVGRRVLRW